MTKHTQLQSSTVFDSSVTAGACNKLCVQSESS